MQMSINGSFKQKRDFYQEDQEIIHEDVEEDAETEIERRISMIIDCDDAPKGEEFKKVPLITNGDDEDDKFGLNPAPIVKPDSQFSFNKKGAASDESGSSSRGKVTIPIDWDHIIDRYIKNTNTNVMEANQSSSKRGNSGSRASAASDEDDM